MAAANPVQQSQDHLTKNKVREVPGEAVNDLIATGPADAAGVLSRLIRRRAFPAVVDRLVGREVLDSRGNPTVEVDVYALYCGEVVLAGRSSAPSGASTGSNEAREVRDKEAARYDGKGTRQAANNVTTIISASVRGLTLDSQQQLDRAVLTSDRSELKLRLGGNATTASSFALAEAAASLQGVELFEYFSRQYLRDDSPRKYRLPTPFFNILNGGKHAGGNLKIQEFMIAPSEALPFPEQLRVAAEVYQTLGGILARAKGVSAKNLGDEGGFAPPLETPEEAIGFIEEAIGAAGYAVGQDVRIGLDAAASEFYDVDAAEYEVEVGVKKTGKEMVEYWAALVDRHPAIVSIEDGLHEKDYAHWVELNALLGSRVQLVGDDLYTTNPKTIKQGLEHGWCNALLLKVNQIGTITEAMEAARLVLDKNQKVMVSHRSGETCNSVIADLAVGIGAQYIKTGSTARGERIQKYTRLLQIYDYLKEHDLLAE
jgi:enolase